MLSLRRFLQSLLASWRRSLLRVLYHPNSALRQCRPVLTSVKRFLAPWGPGTFCIVSQRSFLQLGGFFYLQFGLFYLRLVFLLLTVDWLGRFCSRLKLIFTVKKGFVFFAYCSPPFPEIVFGPFCLRLPHCKLKDLARDYEVRV